MSTDSSPALTTVFNDDKSQKRRLKKSKLVVLQGPDRGKELVIERERVTVGRSVICELPVSDKAVSSTHFEIVANEKGFVLRDLDSTNGTYVGDLRVREVWIKPGVTIRAGQTHLRFEPTEGTIDFDLSKEESFHDLVGKSVRMREIFATLEKIAPAPLTVLVRGETGTGKELVARALHKASRRASQSFVVQDCGSIPRDLIESTLFGHEKGSFTGATDRHKGCFEQADGGTIFLDEIGELDISLQPKLLRVLENREIKRVGGDRTIPVDVRVVAATNRDLRQMVNAGTFREDLYFRLSVVQVEIPPLRERPEDIALIAEKFLRDYSERRYEGEEARKLTLSSEAKSRIQTYPFPGNVRELKNMIERGAAITDTEELGVGDLFPGVSRVSVADMPLPGGNAEQFVQDELPFKEAKQRILDAFEASYLKALLDKHNGNVTRSAQSAGLTRYHLRELAKKYGIRGGADD